MFKHWWYSRIPREQLEEEALFICWSICAVIFLGLLVFV